MPSARFAVPLLLCAVQCVMTSYTLVTRSAWGAYPPVITPLNLTLPVHFVVVHHSYIPSACNTRDTCSKAMKGMQHMHQVTNRWNDIGYNFAVGGDGSVYEGRGWDVVGAHAPKYNFMSVGICFIGDYRTELPSASMLLAARQLILHGVDRGSIHSNYTLVGHRQVRKTECPGGALFQEIQSWLHWKPVEDIQPRATPTPPPYAHGAPPRIGADALSNITTDPPDSNNIVPNITIDPLDSNNIVPNNKDDLSNSNNIVPNITIDPPDSNNTVPNVTDDLSDSNNNVAIALVTPSDSNNTVPNVTDDLSDSNNNVAIALVTPSDSNNTVPNITVDLTDSNSTVPITTDDLS